MTGGDSPPITIYCAAAKVCSRFLPFDAFPPPPAQLAFVTNPLPQVCRALVWTRPLLENMKGIQVISSGKKGIGCTAHLVTSRSNLTVKPGSSSRLHPRRSVELLRKRPQPETADMASHPSSGQDVDDAPRFAHHFWHCRA